MQATRRASATKDAGPEKHDVSGASHHASRPNAAASNQHNHGNSNTNNDNTNNTNGGNNVANGEAAPKSRRRGRRRGGRGRNRGGRGRDRPNDGDPEHDDEGDEDETTTERVPEDRRDHGEKENPLRTPVGNGAAAVEQPHQNGRNEGEVVSSRLSADGGDESARGAAGDAGPFFRAAAESDAFARESDAIARAPRTATPIIALVICRDVRLKRTREMVSALSTPSFGFHFILRFNCN